MSPSLVSPIHVFIVCHPLLKHVETFFFQGHFFGGIPLSSPLDCCLFASAFRLFCFHASLLFCFSAFSSIFAGAIKQAVQEGLSASPRRTEFATTCNNPTSIQPDDAQYGNVSQADLCFIDAACIHQTDAALMHRGIRGIGSFLLVSKETVATWEIDSNSWEFCACQLWQSSDYMSLLQHRYYIYIATMAIWL